MNHLDKRQTKFLQQCPKVEKRFRPCFYTSYGDLCFYADEWVCNNQCISKGDVCKQVNRLSNGTKSQNHALEEDALKCDWGLKRCGENRCVSRYTPCDGKCWNEANPNLCGTNLCLHKNHVKVKLNTSRTP